MTGGGFGGSAVALTPVAGLTDVQDAVSAAFAAAGHRTPAFLVATPGDSARVDSLS